MVRNCCFCINYLKYNTIRYTGNSLCESACTTRRNSPSIFYSQILSVFVDSAYTPLTCIPSLAVLSTYVILHYMLSVYFPSTYVFSISVLLDYMPSVYILLALCVHTLCLWTLCLHTLYLHTP